MVRPSAYKSIVLPLRALGGWTDAEWFDPSVLTEDDVVGVSLPKLPGSRKQSFELSERSAQAVAPRKRVDTAPPSLAKPFGIAQILDGIGATRAAVFRRPRFFFKAAPSLFFAEIPSANLTARAADRLRG